MIFDEKYYSTKKYKNYETFQKFVEHFNLYLYLTSPKKEIKLLLNEDFVEKYFKNSPFLIFIAIDTLNEKTKKEYEDLLEMLNLKYSYKSYQNTYYDEEIIKYFIEGLKNGNFN